MCIFKSYGKSQTATLDPIVYSLPKSPFTETYKTDTEEREFFNSGDVWVVIKYDGGKPVDGGFYTIEEWARSVHESPDAWPYKPLGSVKMERTTHEWVRLDDLESI